MTRGRGRPPAAEPDQVHYDITVVDGAAGRRLAAVQAQAILDVLTWLHEHASASESDSDEASVSQPTGGDPPPART